MESTNQINKINCTFCGCINDFEVKNLYEKIDNRDILKEKYCLECGEPLTSKCPSCNSVFYINENIKKQNFNPILKTIWTPKPSIIDDFIDNLKKYSKEYKKVSENLIIKKFLLNQKEFLQNIPQVIEILKSLSGLFSKFNSSPLINRIDKNYTKIIKEIKKNIDECNSIQDNIDSETEVVNEKKEKQLRKNNIFDDLNEYLYKFEEDISKLRKNEIDKEQKALKPGIDKVINYIRQDPDFYKLICPICNSKIFCIDHQIYSIGTQSKQLIFFKSLPKFYQNHKEGEENVKTLRLDFKIHIEKGKRYDFSGQLALLLQKDEIEYIGRDIIREVDYNEPESLDILEDETDPLGRISNKQLSINLIEDKIILTAMKFDERRVGTYLNDMNYDIRIKNPEGIEIKKGDKIIIPLINEIGNPNFIEIIVL